MAPVIPSTSNPSTENRTIKSSDVGGGDDLIVNVRYTNTLPDIPFDTKFLQYPFDPNRFIHYQPTSLEKNYKYEVLAEFDLGVPIDLINPDTYAGKGGDLAPEDEALLEEEVLIPKNTKRSQHHGQSVSWLRRTEYISTEQTRFQPTHMEKVEAKVGFSIKKNFKDEKLYMDISSQIKAIEKTFEDVKIPVTEHYSKPNVYAVEELPILPDFKCWKYPCAQVIFDSDPAPVGRPVPAQIEEMSQAMIRGVMDESGEQFVAYFLPTAETLEKRRQDVVENRPYDDDGVYEYSMAREYNWNVKSKSSIGYEENYFLVARDSGVYYNELETRVRLSKRRQIAGQNSLTKLVVRHRPLDEQEFNMLKVREKAIEEVIEEEEEEEEEEQEEQTKKEDEQDKRNKNQEEQGEDDTDEEEEQEEVKQSKNREEEGEEEEEDDNDDDDDDDDDEDDDTEEEEEEEEEEHAKNEDDEE